MQLWVRISSTYPLCKNIRIEECHWLGILARLEPNFTFQRSVHHYTTRTTPWKSTKRRYLIVTPKPTYFKRCFWIRAVTIELSRKWRNHNLFSTSGITRTREEIHTFCFVYGLRRRKAEQVLQQSRLQMPCQGNDLTLRALPLKVRSSANRKGRTATKPGVRNNEYEYRLLLRD